MVWRPNLDESTPLSEAQINRGTWKVDVRLPGKENPNSHGARPVHQIIAMIKWIRTRKLSMSNSLSNRSSAKGSGFGVQGSGFRVQISGFRVQGSGLRQTFVEFQESLDGADAHGRCYACVWGLRFGVWGLGFGV